MTALRKRGYGFFLALVATAALAYTFGPFKMSTYSWSDPGFFAANQRFLNELQGWPQKDSSGKFRYMRPYDTIRFEYLDGIIQFNLSPTGVTCYEGLDCAWLYNPKPLEQAKRVASTDQGGVSTWDASASCTGTGYYYAQTGYWGQDVTFVDPWMVITAYWVDTGIKLVQKNPSRMRCV